MWDPAVYQRFSDERSRPFVELVSRITATNPSTVVDLGCGPATQTALLAERWPRAHVLGLDSSPAMVAAAEPVVAAATAAGRNLEVRLGDLRDWRPVERVDVVVSNATLQWVPGHLDLLPDLVESVAAGGWFAFQVPGNFGEPSHTLLRALSDSPQWRDRVGPDRVARPDSHDPLVYLHRLAALGLTVDVWETTYLQVLSGDDPVLDWVSGTALRPVLSALSRDEAREFTEQYAMGLRKAYPLEAHGTVLPFRRVFVVARKP